MIESRPRLAHPGNRVNFAGDGRYSPPLMSCSQPVCDPPSVFGIRLILLTVLCGAAMMSGGCSSGFERIDREVDSLVAESSAELSEDVASPKINRPSAEARPVEWRRDPTATDLPTVNPPAGNLPFTPQDEADLVTDRLNRYAQQPDEVTELTLNDALAYAIRHSRDYRFEEEEFLLAALRLLIERHRWGPRFFNDVSATVSSAGTDGRFDTALQLVNEFGVTQRLPYGGEVSARALAEATDQLHGFVADDDVQSAELILSADIPLLRGAGDVAREDRIQAERNLIYAARSFERFRREFLFDIATDFLGLVVQQQGIENAERQVESLEWLEARSRELVRAGRETSIDLALAEQATLFARDSLNSARENYRLAVDRFKVRLGMPEDLSVAIVRSDLGLPTPKLALEDAVAAAFTNRLDLQTQRDRLDDARRAVRNAKNLVLPDLDLFASASIPTDPTKKRGGVGFSPDDASLQAGITFGLPLDREIERLNVRQAQINLERSLRTYNRFRDDIAIDARAAVRAIDRALFSLQIQEENVVIAEKGMEAIEADPDRATARDRSEAVDRLLRAQDQRDSARRDLQVAILGYLLDTGQLRVDENGRIIPLQGMELRPAMPAPDEPIP